MRTTSGVAYSGVLIALDEYLAQKEGLKFKKPKSIEEYKSRISGRDKKLLALLVGVYDSLHLAGYYHGKLQSKRLQMVWKMRIKLSNIFTIDFENKGALPPCQNYEFFFFLFRQNHSSRTTLSIHFQHTKVQTCRIIRSVKHYFITAITLRAFCQYADLSACHIHKA